MGKSKRTKVKKGEAVIEYDSDDERKYANDPTPDKRSDDYFNDDIDQFHSSRNQLLLNKRKEMQPASSSSEEEEVMPIHSDSEDEIAEYTERLKHMKRLGVRDKHSSDSEDEQEAEDFGLPSDKAWGKRKQKYYGADVAEDDRIDFSGSDMDDALLEEQEALKMQKKLAEELEEDDFCFELLKVPKKVVETEIDTQVVEKDLSKLSKNEKIALLKKESPEFIELVDDCKSRINDLKDNIFPVYDHILNGHLPDSTGTEFIKMKMQLIMSYSLNVNFYLMLKAKMIRVENHPVINRLVQIRNLLKQTGTVDEHFNPKLKEIMIKIANGEQLNTNASEKTSTDSLNNRIKKKTIKSHKRKLSRLLDSSSESEADESVHGSNKDILFETKGEKEALEFYNAIKGRSSNSQAMPDEEEPSGFEEQPSLGENENLNNEEERRGVTYQIMKNKGLTAKRKKEDRNPRVKHRNKFRKALIKRKGKIRTVRKEMDPYGGELSGIRAGVKKSIKLK